MISADCHAGTSIGGAKEPLASMMPADDLGMGMR
jgi:hypothetical protein